MITGMQPKILLNMDNNGHLTINDEFQEMVLGKSKINWQLVRQEDNLIKQSNQIGWVEWNDDGTFKSIHDEPMVGRALILDPQKINYTWLTTVITEILDNGWLSYIKFKTQNSTYVLEKL